MRNVLKNLAGVAAGLLFGVAAAHAISGGPQYPGGTNVVGTYGGVLTPTASPCPSATAVPTPECSPTIAACSANSIGVFSVSVPQNGLATGTFVMFAQGRVFTGSIQGAADPGKATLKGVLSARYDFTLTSAATPCPIPTPEPACTPSAFTQQITATASGNLKTRITTPSSSASAGSSGLRLKGTATLDISHGLVFSGSLEPVVACEIFMKVTGFKQSNTATTTGG